MYDDLNTGRIQGSRLKLKKRLIKGILVGVAVLILWMVLSPSKPTPSAKKTERYEVLTIK